MSSCPGDGQCLRQCCCGCFDEETDVPLEVCTCGHRHHEKVIGGSEEFDIYCKPNCPHNCVLTECHNFRYCQKKLPKWILDIKNGMCDHCEIMIGKITFTNTQDTCPICLDTKEMIKISCEKHTLCLECWTTLSKTDRPEPMKCPLCRESIWKWRDNKRRVVYVYTSESGRTEARTFGPSQ
jgi:hypothetical protein